MSQPNFTNTPAEVCQCKTLSPVAKLVFGYVNAYTHTTGIAYPSVSRMTEYFGCARSTIFRALKQLEDAQFIRRRRRHKEGGDMTSNEYVNLWFQRQEKKEGEGGKKVRTVTDCSSSKLQQGVVANCDGGSSKLRPYDNTDDNNYGSIIPTPPIPPTPSPEPPGGTDRATVNPQLIWLTPDNRLLDPQPGFDEDDLYGHFEYQREAHQFGFNNTELEVRRAINLLHRHPGIHLTPQEVKEAITGWISSKRIRRVTYLVSGRDRVTGEPIYQKAIAAGKEQHRGATHRHSGAYRQTHDALDAYLAQLEAEPEADRSRAGAGVASP